MYVPPCTGEFMASAKEYLDYLRNDVPLNEEEYDKLSDYDKMRCEVLGTFMVAKTIEEKAGVELSPDFVMAIAKANLSPEQTEKLINAFSENRIASMGEFHKYISNAPEMTIEAAEKVEDILTDVIKETSPELSENEILNEIQTMKQEYRTADEK